MLPSRRRGFQDSSGGQERVRTHLLFSSQSEHHTAKRKKRTHNKFHQMLHKKDEMVQANPDELNPSQWTGNQRVLHFGPMAQRDPFFYYYPKGWDLLYPAQFGFFPYRTNKFRGSSPVVCICAFGIFLMIGGAIMIYFGFFVFYNTPFWRWTNKQKQQSHSLPPIQVAGPCIFLLGALLSLLGLVCSISTSQFLNEKLRYYHHRGQPASVTVYTTRFKQPRAIYESNPYQPLPPPAYPILENRHADSSYLSPHAEMKLYPPVMPGQSTLSLHGRPLSFMVSPYNTLRAISVNRFYPEPEIQRVNSIASQRQSAGSVGASSAGFQRRARSAGVSVHRSSSNRSR